MKHIHIDPSVVATWDRRAELTLGALCRRRMGHHPPDLVTGFGSHEIYGHFAGGGMVVYPAEERHGLVRFVSSFNHYLVEALVSRIERGAHWSFYLARLDPEASWSALASVTLRHHEDYGTDQEMKWLEAEFHPAAPAATACNLAKEFFWAVSAGMMYLDPAPLFSSEELKESPEPSLAHA